MDRTRAERLRNKYAKTAAAAVGKFAASKTFAAEFAQQSVNDVQTVGIGLLLGEEPAEFGIAVRSTLPAEVLDELFLRDLRASADDVDVKIIEPGVAEQGSDPAGPMVEPMRIGSLVRHARAGPGTLGAFVRKNGRIGVLSNNHVLANTNDTPGAHTYYEYEAGGLQSRRIGSLEHRVELRGGGSVNTVDAAYSMIGDPPADMVDVAGRIRLTARSVVPVKNLPVCKCGHMTGFTKGVIRATGIVPLDISYGGGLVFRFSELIEVESLNSNPFSRKGDSGSLIVTEEGDAVGLLVGGARADGGTTKLSYANPIDLVLTRLGVTLVA